MFVPNLIFISGSAKTVFACSVDKLSLILLKIICDWCSAGAKISCVIVRLFILTSMDSLIIHSSAYIFFYYFSRRRGTLLGVLYSAKQFQLLRSTILPVVTLESYLGVCISAFHRYCSLIILKVICFPLERHYYIPINIPLSLNVFSLSSFRNIGILAKIGKITAHPDTTIPTV